MRMIAPVPPAAFGSATKMPVTPVRIVVVSEAALFAGFGSTVVDVTTAALTSVPGTDGAITSIVIDFVVPAVSLDRVQVTVTATRVHFHWLPDARTKVT